MASHKYHSGSWADPCALPGDGALWRRAAGRFPWKGRNASDGVVAPSVIVAPTGAINE